MDAGHGRVRYSDDRAPSLPSGGLRVPHERFPMADAVRTVPPRCAALFEERRDAFYVAGVESLMRDDAPGDAMLVWPNAVTTHNGVHRLGLAADAEAARIADDR